MAVSGVHVRTSVHVTARAYTYTANEIIRIFFEAISETGLNPSQLADQQPVVERGLRTWLTTRKLDAAYLEVWDPATGKARVRVDLNLSYEDRGKERYDTDIGMVRKAVTGLGVHRGCEYRVVVTLLDGAADVDGWNTTDLRNIDHLQQQDVGQVISTSGTRVGMFTWR
jgi:hypothetical protein